MEITTIMVNWIGIAGIILALVGIVVIPFFAIQQLYSSVSAVFPITVALSIALTVAGVHLHYLSERREMVLVYP